MIITPALLISMTLATFPQWDLAEPHQTSIQASDFGDETPFPCTGRFTTDIKATLGVCAFLGFDQPMAAPSAVQGLDAGDCFGFTFVGPYRSEFGGGDQWQAYSAIEGTAALPLSDRLPSFQLNDQEARLHIAVSWPHFLMDTSVDIVAVSGRPDLPGSVQITDSVQLVSLAPPAISFPVEEQKDASFWLALR